MTISLLSCSAQITETEDIESINFKVTSFTGDYIKEVEIVLKNPIEDEAEFIYLMVGNLKEKNCKKVKVNFKVGEHERNKNIKMKCVITNLLCAWLYLIVKQSMPVNLAYYYLLIYLLSI